MLDHDRLHPGGPPPGRLLRGLRSVRGHQPALVCPPLSHSAVGTKPIQGAARRSLGTHLAPLKSIVPVPVVDGHQPPMLTCDDCDNIFIIQLLLPTVPCVNIQKSSRNCISSISLPRPRDGRLLIGTIISQPQSCKIDMTGSIIFVIVFNISGTVMNKF